MARCFTWIHGNNSIANFLLIARFLQREQLGIQPERLMDNLPEEDRQ